jgi:DNA-binding LytR/AlgR family response regulator
MVKIAFCDADIAVVRQIAALLNKYRETRDQPMECHAFESSLELLAAMEQGLRPDVLLLDESCRGKTASAPPVRSGNTTGM